MDKATFLAEAQKKAEADWLAENPPPPPPPPAVLWNYEADGKTHATTHKGHKLRMVAKADVWQGEVNGAATPFTAATPNDLEPLLLAHADTLPEA